MIEGRLERAPRARRRRSPLRCGVLRLSPFKRKAPFPPPSAFPRLLRAAHPQLVTGGRLAGVKDVARLAVRPLGGHPLSPAARPRSRIVSHTWPERSCRLGLAHLAPLTPLLLLGVRYPCRGGSVGDDRSALPSIELAAAPILLDLYEARARRLARRGGTPPWQLRVGRAGGR